MASSTISTAILARDLLETLSPLRRSTRRAVGKPWPAADLTGAQIELLRVVSPPAWSFGSGRPQADFGVAADTVSTLVRQLGDAGLLNATGRSPMTIGRLALTVAARRRLTTGEITGSRLWPMPSTAWSRPSWARSKPRCRSSLSWWTGSGRIRHDAAAGRG